MAMHFSKRGALLLACGGVVSGLLLVSAAASAEWERQRMNPQEQEKGFLAICAVSDTFAVAAGVIKQGSNDAGAVFVTRDGATWSNATPPSSGGPLDIHMYISCYFADETTGYVGGLGELFVTTDGALTWTRVGLGGLMGGLAVTAIAGLGPGAPIYAVTSTGLLATSENGVDWTEVAAPLGDVSLGGLVFTDADHGWVFSGEAQTDETTGEVTGYSDGGLALTTDGGATWQVVFEDASRQVERLRFVDASHGWMLSESLSGTAVEQTIDGGLTWEPAPVPAESMGGAVSGFVDLFFFDRCEGMILGSLAGNDWGAVWRTTDGGATWSEFDREFLALGQVLGITIEAGFYGVDFARRDVGWATGSNETIFRYDADEDAPACEGGGDSDGDGDGDGDDEPNGRCSCRAAGARRNQSPSGWSALFILIPTTLWLSRRGWLTH